MDYGRFKRVLFWYIFFTALSVKALIMPLTVKIDFNKCITAYQIMFMPVNFTAQYDYAVLWRKSRSQVISKVKQLSQP